MPRSWSHVPESRAIHLDHKIKIWVRWLYRCALPLEHIAIVLDVDFAAAAAALVHRTHGSGRHWEMPTAAPCRTDGRRRRPILAQNSTKVRRLHELSYTPPAIAKILDVRVKAVEDLLRRCVPMRRAALVRPRSRTEQARIRPPRPRREPPAEPTPIDPADLWRHCDGPAPYDRPMATIAPAADVELDLVGAELVPPATPPARNAWVGSASWRPTGEEHGHAKLTWPLVREVRRLHAAGWSCYALARQLGVHPGTIAAIVKHRTWVEDGDGCVTASNDNRKV